MESRGRIRAGISAPLGRSQTSERERGGENVKILHRGRWWPKKVLCGGDFGLAGPPELVGVREEIGATPNLSPIPLLLIHSLPSTFHLNSANLRKCL